MSSEDREVKLAFDKKDQIRTADALAAESVRSKMLAAAYEQINAIGLNRDLAASFELSFGLKW